MAGHSHKHTRLVSYKEKRHRRPFKTALWMLIPLAALLAFILALILGNTLGEKVPDGEGESSTPHEIVIPNPDPHGPISINAIHVTLQGITGNTAQNVSAQIPSGATAVSMTLFSDSGMPLYASEVAAEFGRDRGELTLKNTFRPVADKGLYASVLMPSSVKNVPSLRLWTTAAYEATLASELWQAGADEIVVLFDGTGKGKSVLADGFTETAAEYVYSIRRQASELRVGIAITPADLLDSERANDIERLCGVADFCAVDLTAIEDPSELTNILLEISTTVLRHEMRLLLKNEGKSEELLAAADDIMGKLGMKNIQYIG